MNISFILFRQENEIKSSVPQTETSACKMPEFSIIVRVFLKSIIKKKNKKGFPFVLGTFKQFLMSLEDKRIF